MPRFVATSLLVSTVAFVAAAALAASLAELVTRLGKAPPGSG